MLAYACAVCIGFFPYVAKNIYGSMDPGLDVFLLGSQSIRGVTVNCLNSGWALIKCLYAFLQVRRV